ncbi:class I SAM-dependent methyltransferase [Actinacidiphila oryziradicis]|nr:class I SAM-dependent methyltransferase [Actinacidiphila oryziradicis]
MADSWNTIADWYAELLRAGSAMHDFARDILLDRLPDDLGDQRILDLGCGEGILTRAVAARSASVIGIDPAPRLIHHARAAEADRRTGAVYAVDDGCTLSTVPTSSVEWVIAGLSLNNVPDLPAALTAVRRVLVAGGRLVFTVPHPCFEVPHATWTEAEDGTPRRVIGSYLAEGFWRSANPEGARRAGESAPDAVDLRHRADRTRVHDRGHGRARPQRPVDRPTATTGRPAAVPPCPGPPTMTAVRWMVLKRM